MDTNWIEEGMEKERVNARQWGYSEAMNLVEAIVNEAYAAEDNETARLIHGKVWRRLRDERETRLQKLHEALEPRS